jgi:precorrin-2 dehydrogenase/sirohydrochlorin ferrochelatase
MADYPVMLQLKGKRCVIVGAGPVGRRKLQSLLPVEAELVLIAPDADTHSLPAKVTTICRPFTDSDLNDAVLVFAATDNAQTNRHIAAAAKKRGIPVNIADDPEASDFTLPAVSRHGALTFAIGTAGQSPAAAAIIRDNLNIFLTPGWELFLQIAAKLRSRQLTSDSNPLYNRQVLQLLLDQGLIRMLEAGDRVGIERLFASELNAKITLEYLDIDLPKGAS